MEFISKPTRLFTMLVLCFFSLVSAANRTSVHSYIGIGINFNQYDLKDQFIGQLGKDTQLNERDFSGSVSVGTKVTPWLSLESSILVRPQKEITATSSTGNHSETAVNYSALMLAFLPELEINNHVSLYGKAGIIYFNQPPIQNLVKGVYSSSPMLGIGIEYNRSQKLSLRLEAGSSIASKKTPSLKYMSLNAFYHLYYKPGAPNLGNPFPKEHLLYSNELSLHILPPYAFNSQSKLYSKKVKQYQMIEYLRLLTQINEKLALYWGVNAAHFTSRKQHESFYGFSLLPCIRYTFYHSTYLDSYVSGILAGPSYISQSVIDNQSIGKHFIFFDGIQLGAHLGQTKRLNANIEVLHYSNGRLFYPNPGITMPFVFSLGYNF